MKLRLQITKEPGIRFISHLEYQRSLEKAISAGELSPPDQILVQEMWNSLYQKAMQK